MSDTCAGCLEDLDEAIYDKKYNCWICMNCLTMNRNCNGLPTVPETIVY